VGSPEERWRSCLSSIVLKRTSLVADANLAEGLCLHEELELIIIIMIMIITLSTGILTDLEPKLFLLIMICYGVLVNLKRIIVFNVNACLHVCVYVHEYIHIFLPALMLA
jgi:hypothetical protein